MGLYGAYFAIGRVDPSGADWVQVDETICGCSGEDCKLKRLVERVDHKLSKNNIACTKLLVSKNEDGNKEMKENLT
jgi:hypothetical protein